MGNNLQDGTTYYYRAFATNAKGTVYGETKTFTTLSRPTVTTQPATNVTKTSFTASGNISNPNDYAVSEWTIMYRVEGMNNWTAISATGSNSGTFSANITNLQPTTAYEYKVRIKANLNGTETLIDGETLTLTLPSAPTVQTVSYEQLNPGTVRYKLNGSVTDNGNSNIVKFGFVYSRMLNTTPTLGGSFCQSLDQTTNSNNSPFGDFSITTPTLQANNVYYIRAYAINGVDTAYGETITVMAFLCGTSPVVDVDQNIYNTVLIGNQCWMKESMRTTKYADGTPISPGSYHYGISAQTGYIYKWYQMMSADQNYDNIQGSASNPSGVQGICPNGWHLPSIAEWNQLLNYVSSQSEYVCGNDNTSIAKALAYTDYWTTSTNSCAVGNNQEANNSTGFSAIPDGTTYIMGNGSEHSGETHVFAHFWSTTTSELDNNAAARITLNYSNNHVEQGAAQKTSCLSVRCVKD